jgi:hypothetical protein
MSSISLYLLLKLHAHGNVHRANYTNRTAVPGAGSRISGPLTGACCTNRNAPVAACDTSDTASNTVAAMAATHRRMLLLLLSTGDAAAAR